MILDEATGLEAAGLTEAYRRVRQAILSGELPPGAKLSQLTLAKQLNLSRTPLREALRMVQRDGLITASPGRSIVISPTTVQDLDELYALRINLEATAARIAVSMFRPEKLLELKDILTRMTELEQIEHFEGWDELHRRFHNILIEPAGKRSVQLAAQLSEHAERYRRLYLSQPTSWLPARRDHTTILSHYEVRDADGVGRALAEHYARTALTVAALIDSTYEPHLVRSAVRDATLQADSRRAMDRKG